MKALIVGAVALFAASSAHALQPIPYRFTEVPRAQRPQPASVAQNEQFCMTIRSLRERQSRNSAALKRLEDGSDFDPDFAEFMRTQQAINDDLLQAHTRWCASLNWRQ